MGLLTLRFQVLDLNMFKFLALTGILFSATSTRKIGDSYSLEKLQLLNGEDWPLDHLKTN